MSLPPETGYKHPSGHSHHLGSARKPIDGSESNPFPPPPDGWRPSGLVRVEENECELALWDRVRRIAAARGVSVRAAAAIVAGELSTPVSGEER